VDNSNIKEIRCKDFGGLRSATARAGKIFQKKNICTPKSLQRISIIFI